jgi:TldD protein
MRAMDVAHSAGATYADVRLTRTIDQAAGGMLGLHFKDTETFGLCVRALVKGAWGFAATSSWTDEEVVRIATAAAAQATTNTIGVIQPIELASAPAVTGSWMTPIREDPFLIPWEVKLNIIEGTTQSARQQLPETLKSGGKASIPMELSMACHRQERVLATTDGTFTMQSIYRTGGGFAVSVEGKRGRRGNATATGLETSGRGFEIFAEAKLLDQLARMVDEADADAAIPVRPVEVGQDDVVCDAATVASLLDQTFGRATELDRALGYEANAGGTSYLGPDPMTWLGQSVASPLMTITADRTHPTGVATVQWDDDGVKPEAFPLLQEGHVVDYQTTREHAPRLSPWYATRHQTVRSHGCAASEDARSVTL